MAANAAPRERNRPLRVVVSAEERAVIEGAAEAVGLSVSAYLRSVGLGYEPKSRFDQETVRALAKVAGDQGRIAGLMKLWLVEKPGEGASEYDVQRLLLELQGATAQVRELVGRL